MSISQQFLAIGAYADDMSTGIVYLYRQSAGRQWEFSQFFQGSSAGSNPTDKFGGSLALSDSIKYTMSIPFEIETKNQIGDEIQSSKSIQHSLRQLGTQNRLTSSQTTACVHSRSVLAVGASGDNTGKRGAGVTYLYASPEQIDCTSSSTAADQTTVTTTGPNRHKDALDLDMTWAVVDVLSAEDSHSQQGYGSSVSLVHNINAASIAISADSKSANLSMKETALLFVGAEFGNTGNTVGFVGTLFVNSSILH
jgi:hypothetical protein